MPEGLGGGEGTWRMLQVEGLTVTRLQTRKDRLFIEMAPGVGVVRDSDHVTLVVSGLEAFAESGIRDGALTRAMIGPPGPLATDAAMKQCEELSIWTDKDDVAARLRAIGRGIRMHRGQRIEPLSSPSK